jgi:hypothetical protein
LIDLASAFVSYAETTYGNPGSSKWDKMKVMAALHGKIVACTVTAMRKLRRASLIVC